MIKEIKNSKNTESDEIKPTKTINKRGATEIDKITNKDKQMKTPIMKTPRMTMITQKKRLVTHYRQAKAPLAVVPNIIAKLEMTALEIVTQ
ncbi:23538_t:CDS:2 [Dentiscutata erythropus]|uniref:23538_t:CDS:1 n=1 Tax=Dentiscutata erythropus TaxID=1348616 RepID=A0A9N8VB26_9GLOM|nr:23538_t:CDS:2 [Dentiscutata erythropus]